jgi:hypothetical protein
MVNIDLVLEWVSLISNLIFSVVYISFSIKIICTNNGQIDTAGKIVMLLTMTYFTLNWVMMALYFLIFEEYEHDETKNHDILESYQFLFNYFLNCCEYQCQIHFLFQLFSVKSLLTCKSQSAFLEDKVSLRRICIIVHLLWGVSSLITGVFYILKTFFQLEYSNEH